MKQSKEFGPRKWAWAGEERDGACGMEERGEWVLGEGAVEGVCVEGWEHRRDRI